MHHMGKFAFSCIVEREERFTYKWLTRIGKQNLIYDQKGKLTALMMTLIWIGKLAKRIPGELLYPCLGIWVPLKV